MLYDKTDEKKSKADSKVGFQYVDFFIEGVSLLFICRMARYSANNYHDANYITFHRIDGFRDP